MATLIADIRTDVFAESPDCPAPLVDRAIRRAAIELCEWSPVWAVDLDGFTPKAGQQVYDLRLPAAISGEIIAVVTDGVRYQGRALPFATIEEANRRYQGWRSDTGPEISGHVMLTPRKLALIPIPETDLPDTIEVRVSARPRRDASALPDDVASDWYECITEGALWFLQSMPGQPWSQPNMALIHRRRYRQELNEALRMANAGFRRGSVRARPKGFIHDVRRQA